MSKKFGSLFLVIVLLVSLSSLALAGERDPPHQFFGSVLTNGQPAPDGVLVVARIDGVDVAATTTKDGYYGFAPNIFYIPDNAEGRAGKTITFFVKDLNNNYIESASAVFSNGLSTRLDLSVSGVFTKPSSSGSGGSSSGGSGGSSGGSGGSSGGGSFVPSSNNKAIDDSDNQEVVSDEVVSASGSSDSFCSPDWSCSEWLDCLGGQQRRVCVDNNACGTSEGKPEEVRSCVPLDLEASLEQERKSTQGFFSRLTGAVVGSVGSTVSFLGVLLLVLLLALVALLVARRIKEK